MPLDMAEIKDEILDTFKEVNTDLNKKMEDQSQVLDALKTAVKGKADTAGLETRLKDGEETLKKLSETADELEKKMNRGSGTGEREVKSVGQVVVESKQFKTFQDSPFGELALDLKALLTADVTLPTSTTFWGVPKEVAPMVTVPRMPTTVRSLFPQGRTSSNAVEFMQWTRGEMNAKTVAEGAQKPESDIAVPTLTTVPIRTIAHLMHESVQLMDDSPAFQTIIDQEMRRGLMEKENDQLLTGDGTGANLTGILPNATTFEQKVSVNKIPGGINASAVDVVRWAKLAAAKKYYPADTIVMHPQDWATIELGKSTTEEYLFSAFTSGATPRLWGLRVIEDWNIPIGKFLVGGFATGARVWDRERPALVISTENKDNVEKNMITIRAEERLALTIYRPDAFVYGAVKLVA